MHNVEQGPGTKAPFSSNSPRHGMGNQAEEHGSLPPTSGPSPSHLDGDLADITTPQNSSFLGSRRHWPRLTRWELVWPLWAPKQSPPAAPVWCPQRRDHPQLHYGLPTTTNSLAKLTSVLPDLHKTAPGWCFLLQHTQNCESRVRGQKFLLFATKICLFWTYQVKSCSSEAQQPKGVPAVLGSPCLHLPAMGHVVGAEAPPSVTLGSPSPCPFTVQVMESLSLETFRKCLAEALEDMV